MMKKKSKLNEFFIAGGVVSRKPFDDRLDTPVRGSGVKLSSLVKEGNPESWNESEATMNVQRFLEDVKNYAQIGNNIYRETNLKEIAVKISEIVESAKIHTMNETDDWFDRVSVKRNMKELGNLASGFVKAAKESNLMQRRMETLYEDMGNILSRYYEIEEASAITEAEKVDNLDKPESGGKEEYQKFFKSALKKFGVDSPDELDEEDKKEFFNWVDKNWANKK
jgi:hypothetical protein|tara:strand:- start:2842 stop:3513 length:672 start_codon:yes stop_codon:yes gene_type:complete